MVKPIKKESKADMFIRLAKPRVEKVLKSLNILSNCSNRSSYEYTQEQIVLISDTLYKALEVCLDKFIKSKKEQETFEF